MAKPPSVLFVCMGNICRSPAAEGLFLNYLKDQNQETSVRVDSAGTHGYHIGDLADPRMRTAAASRGIELASRARRVIRQDLASFDLVLAMDRENFTIIDSLDEKEGPDFRSAELKLFSDFLGDAKWPTDVPDPYYGGADGFENVLDMIEAGCPAILDYLLKPSQGSRRSTP